MDWTVRIETGTNGWSVGQLAELPAVLAQGRTEAELSAELREALNFYLETQRETASSDESEGVRFLTFEME